MRPVPLNSTEEFFRTVFRSSEEPLGGRLLWLWTRARGEVFMGKAPAPALVLALALCLGASRGSGALDTPALRPGSRPPCNRPGCLRNKELAAGLMPGLRGGAELVQCTFAVATGRLGPGETVVLTGAGVALHSWAPWTLSRMSAEASSMMPRVEHGAHQPAGNTFGARWWSTTIDLPVGDTVDFKFAIRSPDGVLTWEPCQYRRTTVPDALTHRVVCAFGDVDAVVAPPTPVQRGWPLLAEVAEVLEWMRGLLPRLLPRRSGEAHAGVGERALAARRERAAPWGERETAIEQAQCQPSTALHASPRSWLSGVWAGTGWALSPSAVPRDAATIASPSRQPSAAAVAAAAAATAAAAVVAPSVARRVLLVASSPRARVLLTPIPAKAQLSLTRFCRDYLVEGFMST